MEEASEKTTGPARARAERTFARVVAGLAWQFRVRLGLTLLVTVARMACLAGVVHFLHEAIDCLLNADTRGPAAFAWAAGALLACQVCAAGLHFLADELHRWFMEGVEVASFQWAMRRLIWLPADYFRANSLPQFILRIEKLQMLVRGFLLSGFTMLAKGSAIVGVVAGILPRSLGLGGVGLGLLAVVAGLVLRRTGRLRQAAELEMGQDLRFMDHTLGIFTNVRDLHNYGLREQALRQFGDSCTVLAGYTLQVARLQARVGLWLNAAGIVLLASLVAVVLGLGTDAATALTCFAALGMILEPLSDVVRSHTAIQNRSAKIGELLELIEGLGDALGAAKQVAGRRLDSPITHLRLEGVGYARDGVPILEGISFEARAGEIIGVVGRSGAGKTTLAHLILRLIEPTSGRLWINGVDAAELDPASFWRQVGCINQLNCQVGGTIRDEVTLARPEADEAEIRAALGEAGIDVDRCDEPIERDGWHESAGGPAWRTRSLQQRVQWARLWLKKASLVVLDEPTSLADPASEQRFVRGLVQRERRQDRITLLISHRPGTLAACDRLLVLDHGRLVDHGPRADILARWLPGIEPDWELAS